MANFFLQYLEPITYEYMKHLFGAGPPELQLMLIGDKDSCITVNPQVVLTAALRTFMKESVIFQTTLFNH